MNAAKTLALTGIDLLLDKSLIEKATEEWSNRRGANYKYVSLLGNRKPPLDYQKK